MEERRQCPTSLNGKLITSVIISLTTSNPHWEPLILFSFHILWASQTCWPCENKPSEKISKQLRKKKKKVILFTAAGTVIEFQLRSTTALWAGSFQNEKPLGLGFVSNLPHLSSLLYKSLSRRILF